MTAPGVSSLPQDAAIVGIVAARWPAPVRYALAVGFLLVGIGALAAIDLVLLPRYFDARTRAVPQLQPTLLRPATVPLAPHDVLVVNPEPQPKEQPPARPPIEPALPSAPAIPAFPHLLFAMRATKISPAAASILRRVAATLKQEPRLHVVLGGHTDDLGTATFNAVLSLQRAQQCSKSLERYGVEPERIETHGFGATRPLDGARSFPARTRNRRVEIDLR
jgi:outer membrane protein OmpA-like peptidoglycan-associated protein